jgi:hypothetical protein
MMVALNNKLKIKIAVRDAKMKEEGDRLREERFSSQATPLLSMIAQNLSHCLERNIILNHTVTRDIECTKTPLRITVLCSNIHLPWGCQQVLILSTVLIFTGFKWNHFKVRETAQIVRQT